MKLGSTFLIIILTAALAGGGAYLWKESELKTLNQTTEQLMTENLELKTELAAMKEENKKSQMLTLEADSPECTEEPASGTNDMGGKFTNYPVAEEYKTTADDYHKVAGLFTAAACGESRLNALFGSKSFEDVALFTENSSDSLAEYLKENDFVCSDEGASDSECNRWYNSGSVPLEVMTGLRKWAEMIYGSDCQNCG